MSRSPFIVIVLSLSTVLTGFIASPLKNQTTVSTGTNNPELKKFRGISDYCKKSQLKPRWYVPTPIECCSHEGECEMFIEPSESRYGLTNPDPKWRRRHCNCDRRLYRCVTRNLTDALIARADYGFRQEMCIIPNLKVFSGEPQYQFVNFMSVLPPK